MNSGDILVYFLDEGAVPALLPSWPTDMQAAFCLTSEGSCDLVVHHSDEVASVLERVVTLHGRCGQDLCVVPQIEGYETRKVLFSQEQQLLSLIAGNPHLAEMAADYAARFARKQGGDDASPEGAAEALRMEEPQDHVLSARTRARLERDGDVIRLIVSAPEAACEEAVVQMPHPGCRDDFARFALPLAVLDGWLPGMVAAIDLPADLFPVGLAEHASLDCELTVIGSKVFVSSARIDPPETVQRAHKPDAPTPRKFFKSLHMAVAALLAMMMVSGHFATARDSYPQLSTARYSPDSAADAALDLIAAMALADAVSWMPSMRP